MRNKEKYLYIISVILILRTVTVWFSGLNSAQNLLYELNKDLEAIRNLPLNSDVLDVGIFVRFCISYICSLQNMSRSTVMWLSIGTPKNDKFSICSKWKNYYF